MTTPSGKVILEFSRYVRVSLSFWKTLAFREQTECHDSSLGGSSTRYFHGPLFSVVPVGV